MFTRTNTYDGDAGRLDEGIAFARDKVAPLIATLEGNRGMSVLVDRDTGRCMVNSVWTTMQAMRASNTALTPLREQGGQILGSPAASEEWEIALMHEMHPVEAGCGLRVTRVTFDPADADSSIDTVRTTTIPASELLPGFCRLTMLVDRKAGKGMALTSFENPDAMQKSRKKVEQIRKVSTEKAHATVESVHEYELAFTSLALEPKD